MNPLSGYAACKSVVVTHTDDGTQTNYQMKLTIVKGDGSDSAGTTYLDNKALNWPYDIRFTKADGVTLLDFWREEYDATDGTWWIEVDSIPDPDNATIYLHVGDADATDASNGENTFLLFDHFDDSSLNTDLWEKYETGGATVVESGTAVVIDTSAGAGNGALTSNSANGYSFGYKAIRARMKTNLFASTAVLTAGGFGNKWLQPPYAIAGWNHNSGSTYNGSYWNYASSYATSAILGWSADTYAVIDFMRMGSGKNTYKVDDANQVDITTQVSTATDLEVTFNAVYVSAQGIVTIDWVLVRNMTLTEPTWGAWGDWETGATLKRSVPRIARIMLACHG